MRRIVLAGAMILGAIAGVGAPAEAQYDRYPSAPRHHGGWNYGNGWTHGGGWYNGGWYNGGSSHHGGGYVYDRPYDGRPPIYNRPGDGLPPLPAQRLPNGQYIVNRPGDGLPPFVVGRPRY